MNITISKIRIDRERLKSALIRYREDYLVPRYQDRDRRAGILRRNMLDAILDVRPETPAEFIQLVPGNLIDATDRLQLKNEIDAICRIVRKM